MEHRDIKLKEDDKHREVLNHLYNKGIIDAEGNLLYEV